MEGPCCCDAARRRVATLIISPGNGYFIYMTSGGKSLSRSSSVRMSLFYTTFLCYFLVLNSGISSTHLYPDR
ncbi:hypothetical protein BDP27DRAFT_1337854, partial [Rhodocollybia butyracea]